jgi:flagellar hook assembly protein FlgD
MSVTVSPNPFREGLTIDYRLPGETRVSLVLYDLNGRAVRQLADENQSEGPHRFVWDVLNSTGNNLHNGIYILKIESAFGTAISKVIYME